MPARGAASAASAARASRRRRQQQRCGRMLPAPSRLHVARHRAAGSHQIVPGRCADIAGAACRLRLGAPRGLGPCGQCLDALDEDSSHRGHPRASVCPQLNTVLCFVLRQVGASDGSHTTRVGSLQAFSSWQDLWQAPVIARSLYNPRLLLTLRNCCAFAAVWQPTSACNVLEIAN